jgi:hypothetical protein
MLTEKQKCSEKNLSLYHSTLEIAHELVWDWSRASAMGGRRMSHETAVIDRITYSLMRGRFVDDELKRKWQKAEVA